MTPYLFVAIFVGVFLAAFVLVTLRGRKEARAFHIPAPTAAEDLPYAIVVEGRVLQDIVRSVLEGAGYLVGSFSTVSEASRALEVRRPALLVIGHLEEPTEVSRFVTAAGSCPTVLLLSSPAEKDHVARRAATGIATTLLKPFDGPSLLAAVERAKTSAG